MAVALSPVLTRVGYIYLCMSQPVHSGICPVLTPTAMDQPGEAHDGRLEPACPVCRNVFHAVCAKSQHPSSPLERCSCPQMLLQGQECVIPSLWASESNNRPLLLPFVQEVYR